MKFSKRSNQGITLIALIITVIVMLILAGVAINMVIGDNGIFKKSDEGAKIYKNAANNESTSLNSVDKEMGDLMEQLQNSEDPMKIVDIVREFGLPTARSEGFVRWWVLTADGKIKLGKSYPGNIFDKLEMDSEVQIEGLPNGNIAHIVGNGETVIALDKEGKVYTFGANDVGQLGNGTTVDSDVAICISDTGELKGKAIKEVFIDTIGTVMAIDKEGKLYIWGAIRNDYSSNVPICMSNEEEMLQDKNIEKILFYEYNTYVVKDNRGKIYVGHGDEVVDLDTIINSQLPTLQGKKITDFKQRLILDSEGKVYEGKGDEVICMSDISPLQGKNVVDIHFLFESISDGLSIVRDEEGMVYTWGDNRYGQLGNGTVGDGSDVPICINDIEDSEIYNKKVDSVITGESGYSNYYICIVGKDTYIYMYSPK